MNYIIKIFRFKIIRQISQFNTALAVNDHSTKSRMPRRPRQAYSHSSLPRMTANRRRPERPIREEEFDTKSLGRGTRDGDPCKVS